MKRLSAPLRRLLGVLALIGGIGAAGDAGAACFSVSVPSGSVNIDYSPLDNTDAVQTFQIEVLNISCGTSAPLIGVANTPIDPSGAAAGGRTVLNFDAQAFKGGATVVFSGSGDQLSTVSEASIDDGQTRSATWTLQIPAHSIVPYAQRDFTIYVAGAIGGVYAYAAVPVHVNVATVTQLSFAGAATTLTMDFHELTSSDSQNIAVLAQATVPFDITWSSANNGVLKNLGDSSWTIPYTALLGGVTINNATPYADLTNGGTQGAISTLPLIVTIGDATNKRAGTYQDIVTIKIQPHP